MDKDDLPRNCHLSWYVMGSAILFVYFNHTDGELRRVQPELPDIHSPGALSLGSAGIYIKQ